MLFRRAALSELEPAQRALAEGRYEKAFALLERASKRRHSKAQQAQLKLHLAALYALYGEDGLESGLLSLQQAAELDPPVADRPRYRALYWEFAAYRKEDARAVKRGALEVACSGDAVACFHAARALAELQAYKQVVKVLKQVPKERLPAYLVWRCWSLLGQAHEVQGNHRAASKAYEHAVALSQGYEKQIEMLHLSACYLELGYTDRVFQLLALVDDKLLKDADERALRYLLLGRAHQQLDNPNLALEQFLFASALEHEASEQHFGLALAMAQTYGTLGQPKRAVQWFQYALKAAPRAQKSYIKHELAFALFEEGALTSAKEALADILEDKGYPYRATVMADLAELCLQGGEFEQAGSWAKQALELGSVAQACLVLGRLAVDAFEFSTALCWFEKAASASQTGDADWLLAHYLISDMLAQDGFKDPERLLRHAVQVYDLTEGEERLVLERHMLEARARLSQAVSPLN